MYSILAVDFKV